MASDQIDQQPDAAFVLGGGGYLGGYQAGMVKALLERGIRPDLVIGTSAGSIQGALIAADPTTEVVDRLEQFWLECAARGVMKVRAGGLIGNLARLRPAVASQDRLHDLLVEYFGANRRIEDLAVPYQACAASVERATARYFDSGPLLPALLASSAVPGLWPPVRIGTEHYIDGGVVETIPVGRAVAYGPKRVYVMRLRQRELPLAAPRWPWQLGGVVFEVSRRHRIGHVIHQRVDGMEVHLLPTGEELLEPPDNGLYTSTAEQVATIRRRVEQGYRSACAYLDDTDGRRAVMRSKPRTTGRAQAAPADRGQQGPAAAAVELSPFLRQKLHRHFELFDDDADDLIQERDFVRVARRIADAFGHDANSPAESGLRAAYQGFWSALCRVADVTGAHGIGRATFDAALAHLTTDPALYDADLHPVVLAILDAADLNGDRVLGRAEIQRLARAFGVTPAHARSLAVRLDTNGDGVVGLDELDEAFRDYFTTDEPNAVGNFIFGSLL